MRSRAGDYMQMEQIKKKVKQHINSNGNKRCRYGKDTWARVQILYFLSHRAFRLLKFFSGVRTNLLGFSRYCRFKLDNTHMLTTLMKVHIKIIDISSISIWPQFNCVTNGIIFFFLLTIHVMRNHSAGNLCIARD